MKVIATEIDIKTDKAEANLNDVVAILGDIKKGLDNNTKATEDNAEATKTLETNFQKAARGVKGFGLALKAAGIGLAIEAFNFLKDSIESNQKFANGLSKVFETLGTVVGVLLESLEPLVDIFGNLGSAIGALVRGDFSKLSEIGSNLVDNFKDLGNNALNFASNLGETVNAANEYAEAVVNLRNETKLANAQAAQQLFIFQAQAEELRQQRDNFNLSVRERIAASKALGDLLSEQYSIELALRQRNLDLAKLELSSNKDNVDLQVAVIEAETELADLRERITGQRSEQLNAENALLKEKRDLELENPERVKMRFEQDVNNEKARTLAVNKVRLKAAEESNKIEEDRLKKQREYDKQAKQQRLDIALSAASTLFEIGKKEQKGTEAEQKKAFKRNKLLGIAQASIQTFQAAQGAYLSQMSIPTPDAPFRAAAAAAVATAAGLANIAKIKSQKFQSVSSDATNPFSGGGGGRNGSAGVGFNPSTPTISALPNFSQTAVGQQGQGSNVRAYVVQDEIENQAALNKRINQKTTL